MSRAARAWRAASISILAMSFVARVGADQVGTWSPPLSASLGGTGNATATAHSIPVNEGSSAQANTLAGTNGQTLIGKGSADPLFKSIGGIGVSTTLGANTLQINNSGPLSAAGTTNQINVSASTGDVTVSLPSTFFPGTTTAVFGGGTPGALNFAGANNVVHGGAGTGAAQDQGSAIIRTPIFGGSGSSNDAQNDRAYICGKTFAGSTTSASTNSFCTAALATAGTAATYYVWLHTEVRDASSPVNTDDNEGTYMVSVKNHGGTLTVGTVTTITTGSAVNDSGALTVGALTATASGTTVTFKTAPSWTVITASKVVLQYTIFTFGGPTTLSPQ